MQKLEEEVFELLPPVQLYMEDAERVIQLIGEASTRVEVEAAEFKLDGPEELRNLRCERTEHFRVVGLTPWFVFSFSSSGVNIFAPTATTSLRGVVASLKDLMCRRRRRWWETPGAPLAFCGAMACLLAAVAIPLGLSLTLGPWWNLTALVVAPICLGLSWKASMAAEHADRSVLVLSERREVPSFWKRNSDKILVGIIVGVVVFIVTALLTLLLARRASGH